MNKLNGKEIKKLVDRIVAEMEQDIRDYEGDPSFDEYLLKLDFEADSETNKAMAEKVLRMSKGKTLCYRAENNFIARCLFAAGHEVCLHSSSAKTRQWTQLNARNHNEKIRVLPELANVLANKFNTIVLLQDGEFFYEDVPQLTACLEQFDRILTSSLDKAFMHKCGFRTGTKLVGLDEYWRPE